MDKELRDKLIKIISAAVAFAAALLLPSEYAGLQLVLFAAAYLLVGAEILFEAACGIRHGEVLDENFLMTVATLGAVFLGEYAEAVAVMLFFQVGEFFQNYAVARSRRSIAELMNIRPEYARVWRNDKWQKLSPEQVEVGEKILLEPGERVPLDAVVLRGNSAVDNSSLTGESLPCEAGVGDALVSGSVNLSAVLEAEVRSKFANSTVAKILDLVENAGSKKAMVENFITRFARRYTPTVVFFAAAVFLVPPLLFAGESFAEWGYRAITFLVISCPCALVISVPLSFFGGIGAASRHGILIKGGNYLEALAHVQTAVFDKTGTLTEGCFSVQQINPAPSFSQKKLLEAAASAEVRSHHPIAASIKAAYGAHIDEQRLQKLQELHGLGLIAVVDGDEIAVGNAKLMAHLNIDAPAVTDGKTAVFVAINGRYAGNLLLADCLKKGAATAMYELKKVGVERTVILSGDKTAVAKQIAAAAKIDAFYAELLPADKVRILEELQQSVPAGKKLLYVGDGINDAPVLARADVGAAMGGIGSDAAIEAADVVIMDDDLLKLPVAMQIARRTLRIANENIVFAIGVKLAILALGACGIASIWAAVFADVGVSVLAVANAMRALFSVKNF